MTQKALILLISIALTLLTSCGVGGKDCSGCQTDCSQCPECPDKPDLQTLTTIFPLDYFLANQQLEQNDKLDSMSRFAFVSNPEKYIYSLLDDNTDSVTNRGAIRLLSNPTVLSSLGEKGIDPKLVKVRLQSSGFINGLALGKKFPPKPPVPCRTSFCMPIFPMSYLENIWVPKGQEILEVKIVDANGLAVASYEAGTVGQAFQYDEAGGTLIQPAIINNQGRDISNNFNVSVTIEGQSNPTDFTLFGPSL